MVLFVLRKPILQMRMHSHPVGLYIRFSVRPFIYFHTSSVRRANALTRLRGCAGSSEPSRVAYVITTIISWAGSDRPKPDFCNGVKLGVEIRFLIVKRCIILNLFAQREETKSTSVTLTGLAVKTLSKTLETLHCLRYDKSTESFQNENNEIFLKEGREVQCNRVIDKTSDRLYFNGVNLS